MNFSKATKLNVCSIILVDFTLDLLKKRKVNDNIISEALEQHEELEAGILGAKKEEGR